MLPLLKLIADKKEHTNQEIAQYIGNVFQLTEEERTELLSSGKTRFYNKVRWALVYLKNAGLLVNTKRATVRITSRGLKVVAKNPKIINQDVLRAFPEFLEFKGLSKQNQVNSQEAMDGSSESETPDDLIESGYRKIKEGVMNDLLEKVTSCTSDFFEKLVLKLLLQLGYGGGNLAITRT